MEFETVIRGAKVVGADATRVVDIGIADGKVAAIGNDLPDAPKVIDAAGLIAVPGCIDVHTHFEHYVEHIGTTNADTFETGSRAAAAGGITTIVNFAFQKKGQSLVEAVESERHHAGPQSIIDYGFHIVPTDLSIPGWDRQIKDLVEDGFSSVKIFTSVYNYALSDGDVLKVLSFARDNGLLVNVHAEDHALCQHLTEGLVAANQTGVERLPQARPPRAEAIATARVARYAHSLGTPVYFVHLSSGEALDEVRRVRVDGGEIYVETRPVYLFLDESKYSLPDREGNKFVCLPPLRSRANQEALWAGLAAGEIQTYATDHAPWMSHQKLDPDRAFWNIPAGVSNVETSIGMLFSEGVSRGRISLEQFVDLTSTNAAKLFGMWPRKGSIGVGSDADITLIDPQKHFRVDTSVLHGAADYDPYQGYVSDGWPLTTISRGEIIAHDGGVLGQPGRGELIRRERYLRP